MSEDDMNMDSSNFENLESESKKERHGCVTAFIIFGVLGTAWSLVQLLSGKQVEEMQMTAATMRAADMYEEAENFDILSEVMQSPDIINMGLISGLAVVVGLIFVWRFKKVGIMFFLAGSALSAVANYLAMSRAEMPPTSPLIGIVINVALFFWAMSIGEKKTINQLD